MVLHKSALKTVPKKYAHLPPVHFCGTCKFSTEVYQIGSAVMWGEHCNAGKSYDEMRHCRDRCDTWEERRYDRT